MSEQKENLSNKYGLVELETGIYFDKKLKQNLILKQNFVELSGDEFSKKAVAMVLYKYEGGKLRTETAQAFVEFGEENLEIVKLDNGEQQELENVIETEAREVVSDGPVSLFQQGGIVPGNNKPDKVPVVLSPEEYQRGERIIEK